MGDLGPQIIGDTFNIKNMTTLRPIIMIGNLFVDKRNNVMSRDIFCVIV